MCLFVKMIIEKKKNTIQSHTNIGKTEFCHPANFAAKEVTKTHF